MGCTAENPTFYNQTVLAFLQRRSWGGGSRLSHNTKTLAHASYAGNSAAVGLDAAGSPSGSNSHESGAPNTSCVTPQGLRDRLDEWSWLAKGRATARPD